MNLLPRDERFFDLFQQHVKLLCQASQLLVTGLNGGYQGMCNISKEIETLERNADDVIHEIFQKLQTTFLTPFDPEDIQALAKSMDDIMDSMEDASFRIVAYRIDPIPEPAVRLAQMVDASCRALAKALEALQERKPVFDHLVEVNRLEDQADAIERTQLVNLFSSDTDLLHLIKHKEVYELLEGATDRCEDAADVLQSVSVKNS